MVAALATAAALTTIIAATRARDAGRRALIAEWRSGYLSGYKVGRDSERYERCDSYGGTE